MSKIQSVLFDKRLKTNSGKRLWTVRKARQWLTNHNLRPLKAPDTSGNFIKFRVVQPSEFDRIRFKTFSDKKGIKARIGFNGKDNRKTISKKKKSYIRRSMNGKRTKVRPHNQRYHKRESQITNWYESNKSWRRGKESAADLSLYAVDFPVSAEKWQNFYLNLVPDVIQTVKKNNLSFKFIITHLTKKGYLLSHHVVIMNPSINKYNQTNMMVVREGSSKNYVFARFDPPLTYNEKSQFDTRKTDPQKHNRRSSNGSSFTIPSSNIADLTRTRAPSRPLTITVDGHVLNWRPEFGDYGPIPESLVDDEMLDEKIQAAMAGTTVARSNLAVDTSGVNALQVEPEDDAELPPNAAPESIIDTIAFNSMIRWERDINTLPKPTPKRYTVFFLTPKGQKRQDDITQEIIKAKKGIITIFDDIERLWDDRPLFE